MLIIPAKKFTRTINDIDNIHEPRRHIVIYVPTNMDTTQNRIFIMNSCIQNGYIGGIQSQSELLYSSNMYYGFIEHPLTVMPNGGIEVNRDAIVRIGSYNYSYRLIDTFKDTIETVNYYDGMFNQVFAEFRNKGSDGSSVVAPSDPRYYNIDHQLVVLDDDSPYFVNIGDEIGFDEIARRGGGIGYVLHDFLDGNTTVTVSRVDISDPYKILKRYPSTLEFVNKTVCYIENFASYIFPISYTIIFDKELGYNVFNVKGNFKKIDKKYQKFDISRFLEAIKYSQDELLKSDFNIRLTIIYKDFQTHVSVLPLETNNAIRADIDNIKMQEYMEDLHNGL